MRRALIAMSLLLLAPPPAMADDVPLIGDVTIAPKATLAITLPSALTTINVNDPGTVDVSVVDGTHVVLIGVGVGKANIVFTDFSGKQTAYHVTVATP